MGLVYLDNAATTALEERVKKVMVETMEAYGNPSSVHSLGRKSKAIVENSRAQIAKLLHCLPSEIIFTSGGTEADNLAILGTVESGDIRTIISSPLEHPAILDSIKKAERLYEVSVKWVNHHGNGDVDLDHLRLLLKENNRCLVSLMHVNNEIGNILDIEKVGNLCYLYSAVFHSDMVQSIGHIPVNLSELPIDMVSCSAHKLNGPKGSGFLYHKKGVALTSQMNGGKQEREARGGTENLIGIAALGETIHIAISEFETINKHSREIKSYFIASLKSQFKNVQFNGESGNLSRSSHAILSVNFPNESNNEMLLFQLDLNGILVSGGSACSSGGVSGSHVLNAIGASGASVRFSFNKYNTLSEVDTTMKVLKDVLS